MKTLDSEKLISGYRNYLFTVRKTEITDATKKNYVDIARGEMNFRWKDLYNESFENFKFDNQGLFKFHKLVRKDYPKRYFTGLLSFIDYLKKEIHHNLFSDNFMKPYYSKNQILYGPPGTGKTYSTIDQVVAICEPDLYVPNNHILNKKAYDTLVKDGRVIFTTFHQSMSYEDFIEGIKPSISDAADDQDDETQKDVNYIIEDGIFKAMCKHAQNPKTQTSDFESLWESYIKQLNQFNEEKIFKSISSEVKFEKELSSTNSIIVRYKVSWNPEEAEGTRPFIVSKNMIKRLFEAKIDGGDSNINGRSETANLVGKGRATHIYAVYKDFYQFAVSNNAFTEYEILNYVIVIDEINRGNVSAIFGELITLIEEDKRLGAENELTVTLPYSKEKFGVPANLHILGTMNTADRSVEALDTALRRRFSFSEIVPKSELLSPSAMITRLFWKYETLDWEDQPFKQMETALREFLCIPEDEFWENRKKIWNDDIKNGDRTNLTYLDSLNTKAELNLEHLLTTINERIEILIDRDHTIGHAYFIKVDSVRSLQESFARNIIPLLQEYFYGDYSKMEMVIGSAFFQDLSKVKKVTFAVKNPEFEVSEKPLRLVNVLEEMSENQFKLAIHKLIDPNYSTTEVEVVDPLKN